jgi:hypothetical protein
MTPEQRQALEEEIIKTDEELAQLIKDAQTIQSQYSEQVARLRIKQSALLAALDE